jgi:hypothetical protein
MWTSNVGGENYLQRVITDSCFRIETKLEIETGAYGGAGLYVWFNGTDNINVVRQPDGGIRTHFWTDGQLETAAIGQSWNPCFLRIEKRGTAYSAFASPDSLAWTYMATWHRTSGSEAPIKYGFDAYNWPPDGPNIPADFDYFRVDPLQGTNVCGDVSGVWDSTGSPYYVTCEITVPLGQTLEIRPGVRVLFTGHYKFNVYGNLQATGTEQDSIVFTRAYPAEELKWWGIRFQGTSADGHLAYCVVENGHASGGDNDNSAGGILLSQCSPLIEYSSIRNNVADSDGGGIVCIDHSSPTIRDCDIFGNSAAFGGGIICRLYSMPLFQRCRILNNAATYGYGGGVHDYLYAVPTFDHCVIAGNSSVWCGAGAQFEEGCGGLFVNCTFSENLTSAEGGALCLTGNSSAELRNCILWNNQASTSPEIHLWNSAVTVSWSDVAGNYQGLGNIDADPLLIDPVNGNFHLQSASPCIDTGDPNSPRGPDSTRADMGAVPFIHTTLMVSPVALNFGLIDLGVDSTMQLTMFNPTAQAIPVTGVSCASTAFTVGTNGFDGVVAPYSGHQLPVTFTPTRAGSFPDTIVIMATQQIDSIIRIPLFGEAQVILPSVDSLVVQKGPTNGIRLDWAPVTHSISGQPVENVIYVIYGSMTASGPFVPFGYATTNSYVHAFILNTQPAYFYQVTADVEAGSALQQHGSAGQRE